MFQRGDTLAHLRPGEAQHLQGQRGIKTRTRHAQPVVERILGPAYGRLRPRRQLAGHLVGGFHQLVFIHAQRHQTDALGLLTAEGLAQQQVVLGLGHATQ